MRRSKFSLSHYKMLTTRMGRLIPIQCVPVIPGDSFRGQNSVLIRQAPLNTPVMHPVSVQIDSWFVPYRIVDPNWEDFITGVDGVTLPTVNPLTYQSDLLASYLDIDENQGDEVLAYPFRVYNKIFNQRYRDQQLHPEVLEDAHRMG